MACGIILWCWYKHYQGYFHCWRWELHGCHPRMHTQQTELQGNDRHPDTTGLPKNPHDFSSVQTWPSEIYDILLSLPKKKAPRWDGITTDLQRLCATGIAESLATLFNLTGHSQMAFFLLHGNCLLSLRFQKKMYGSTEQLQTNCTAFGCWQSLWKNCLQKALSLCKSNPVRQSVWVSQKRRHDTSTYSSGPRMVTSPGQRSVSRNRVFWLEKGIR